MYEYVGPPLTRQSLDALLDRLGVQPSRYSLYGAHSPDSHVMDHRPDGWVVFYTERGEESGVVTFTCEHDACVTLLRRVTSEEHNFFELVAGPAPADVADAQFQEWLDKRALTRGVLTDDNWKCQDSPWVKDQPDYRRYWVRTAAVRSLREPS